jgi:hypothetical protein
MVRIEPIKVAPVAVPAEPPAPPPPPPVARELYSDGSFRSEPATAQQITWRPVGEPRRISFAGSSYAQVRKALFATFGPFPIRLDRDTHLNIIFAMKYAAGEGGVAYDEILKALTALPGIELQDD